MRASRKLITLIIALLAVTVVVAPRPQPASASGACHLTEYRGGVQIWDLPDLLCLKVHWNDYDGTTIYQMNNIELDGWTSPIAYWFGTFDGGGFRIKDDVDPTPQVTLFTDPNGPISINNLHRRGDVTTEVTDPGLVPFTGGFIGNSRHTVTITSSSMTGSVIATRGQVGGFIGGVDTESPVAVEITGSSMNGSVTGDYELADNSYPVGGFVGSAYGAVIITGSSKFGPTSGGGPVGGFVASTLRNSENRGDVTISRSYNTGYVTSARLPSSNVSVVGGFVGNSSDSVTITNSYNTGDVFDLDETEYSWLGGLVASLAGSVTISQSYNTGNLISLSSSVYKYMGGLIGVSFLDVSISDSYSSGVIDGGSASSFNLAGGFVGFAQNAEGSSTSITRSYSLGDVSNVSPDPGPYQQAGEFTGYDNLVESAIENSFCVDTATNCGADNPSVAKTATELKSTEFLSGQNWNFRTVWCIRDSLNDGFPVLRTIDFGPGDTGCRPRRSPSALQSITLDPAGGTCGDHTSAWTQTFRRSFTLPTANDCQRDGYAFVGWTRDPSLTKPENLLTNTVTRSGTLTAVWGALPAAPARVDVIANFLCARNCTSAIVVWPTSTSPTDKVQITIDNSEAVCSFSGQVFGLDWCWVTGLAAGATHSTSVAWRNQYGAGPTTTAEFALA